jgi:hypothetical protein
MLRNNVAGLVLGPANYFLHRSFSRNSLLGCFLTLIITSGIVAGILREVRGNKLKPIHLAFFFFALLCLFWNYSDPGRYFIPFMPLFAAGIWVEAKNVAALVRKTIRGARSLAEKSVAAALGLLLILCALTVGMDYAGGTRRDITRESKDRAGLVQEKREAYDWLSRNTALNARMVAYEAGSAYLYSHRLASRPLMFTTADFYEPTYLTVTLDHATDVAQAIGAEYWITSVDDFDFEWPNAFTKGHTRMREIERVLPLVYQSSQGHVRVYSLGCINHPYSTPCESAKGILFPSGASPALVGINLR